MIKYTKIFQLIFVLNVFQTGLTFSQNALRSGTEQGWGLGWSTNDFWSPTEFGVTTYGKTYQNSLGNGNRYFRLFTSWGGQNREHGPSGNSDIQIPINAATTLETWGSDGKAYYLSTENIADNYIFRTRNGNGIDAAQLIVFRVQGSIQTVTNVSQSPSPSGVTGTSSVTVTAATSGNINTGQQIYLRFTTNNWSTSTIVAMSGTGTSYNATIPGQPSDTTVKYYVFTSGDGLSIANVDADFYTINANNNGGANYQYTASRVTVTPPFPSDNEMVTVAFDATGTALDTASKVYLHSGVSTVQASPTTFNYNKGNWGQDDGIGLMTNSTGKIWTVTLSPGLRSFYNVPSDKDIFGFNFLFRNAAGTLKEDKGGTNYYAAVNPGNFFAITNPVSGSHLAEVNTSVVCTAVSNTIPSTWTLVEINPADDSFIAQLISVNGNNTFSHSLPIINTTQRKFKLEVNYSGTIKSKFFIVTGFNSVVIQPRPSGTKLGVNYHSNDLTKATLVLHTPTFTRFKSGLGAVTGTNPTAPKEIVYVVGDFNNWTASESYKMKRDTSNGISDHGDYWWLELSGLTPGQEYVFQYLVDGAIRVADPYTHKVSDPEDHQIQPSVYPNLISYRSQASDRASVLQTNQQTFNWTATPFAKPTINNLHIYELHFRDFTEEGTYLAAVDKLDYIKDLGINAIHVMPVSEFEGNSSWGYNPNFYFAADKAYGKADDLRLFIDECHKRQIQVFNDVVLNHAFYSNVMAKLYWNTTLNRPANDSPYFNPEHKMVRNTAGHWGADWNHESEHVQNMVDSILGYWLKEFRFDGFRFDFTKGFGQTNPNDFPSGDDWASARNDARINLLKRMVKRMVTVYPGSVPIFEHLANSEEDKILADRDTINNIDGILMWSGVGHHNDLKGFILGNNGDNTNIYNSGVYNASGRNFGYANWMSYGESHDEERLGYEVMQYFNGEKNTLNMIDRLKIAYGFNLLLPGPRMLWQFGELGYDVSINFNGRTGEKPVRWEYYNDPKRRELYRFISYIFQARNKYNLYSTTPDYDNIGQSNGTTPPRVMRLSSSDGKHAILLANLSPTTTQSLAVNYDITGTWYKYSGASNIDGQSFNVTNTGSSFSLSPSETVLLTNFALDICGNVSNPNNDGNYTLRYAKECIIDGDTIFIENSIQSSTVNLTQPLMLDKNITIKSRPGTDITIDGSSLLNTSIFQIPSGKTITLEKIKLKCGSGNTNGRCISNNGTLILKDVEIIDSEPTNTGSAIFNNINGNIQIQNNVAIKKQ